MYIALNLFQNEFGSDYVKYSFQILSYECGTVWKWLNHILAVRTNFILTVMSSQTAKSACEVRFEYHELT